jgi:hypothetical protein
MPYNDEEMEMKNTQNEIMLTTERQHRWEATLRENDGE